MATNVAENKIYIGETIIVNTTLTDKDGNDLEFSLLTSAEVKAFDILGNVLEVTPVEGTTTNSLTYEVDTTKLREGEIKAELQAGQSYFRNAGVEHNTVNINDFEFVFVEVELKL